MDIPQEVKAIPVAVEASGATSMPQFLRTNGEFCPSLAYNNSTIRPGLENVEPLMVMDSQMKGPKTLSPDILQHVKAIPMAVEVS